MGIALACCAGFLGLVVVGAVVRFWFLFVVGSITRSIVLLGLSGAAVIYGGPTGHWGVAWIGLTVGASVVVSWMIAIRT